MANQIMSFLTQCNSKHLEVVVSVTTDYCKVEVKTVEREKGCGLGDKENQKAP